MSDHPVEIRPGIVMFEGKVSRNMLVDPMVSHCYFLEDGDEVIIFDPSCGRSMGRRVEAHIRSRQEAQAKWRRAILIAGHSHMDHAGNFYLSDVLGAPETYIYVHEAGLEAGKVKSEPVAFIENAVLEMKRYYNPYLAFSFPYSLITYPVAALDALSPALAREAFAFVGGMAFPDPKIGAKQPEPLRLADRRAVALTKSEVLGWGVGNKVVLPVPGHSPCSVALFWPEQKALFISDADWVGNPVFISSSMRDSLSSLKSLKTLAEAEGVELLLPAHGAVKRGVDQVIRTLELAIRQMEVMRDEILATCFSCGEEKDIRRLARVLTRQSPRFRMLKSANYPRMVVFVHNIVAVCLAEEGLLP